MDQHIKTVGFRTLDNGYILEYYQSLNGQHEIKAAQVHPTIYDVLDAIGDLDRAFEDKVSPRVVDAVIVN